MTPTRQSSFAGSLICRKRLWKSSGISTSVCYLAPSPEHVQPTDNTNPPCPVASSNGYRPDVVGWYPFAANYIRSNSPLYSITPLIPNFPCGATVYQALSVLCPGGTTGDLYVPSQTLSATVYQYYVENCRAGVCSFLDF